MARRPTVVRVSERPTDCTRTLEDFSLAATLSVLMTWAIVITL
jgi:hypothetical protein